MAGDPIVCGVCGASNDAGKSRCASCGARLDQFAEALTADELHDRRYQQDGFEWKWVFAAFVVYMVLQVVALVVLPMVINAYDPQGLPGMMISAGLWFVGGMIVGIISPGKTFFEPTVGAFLAIAPTILWLRHISDVSQLSLPAYIIAGIMGVMITLFGAFAGERLQMAMKR